MWSKSILWSKAQLAPERLNVWNPNSWGSRPILDIARFNTKRTLLAVRTDVAPFSETVNNGLSLCMAFDETTRFRADTGHNSSSASDGSCTTCDWPETCIFFEHLVSMCAPGGPQITSP